MSETLTRGNHAKKNIRYILQFQKYLSIIFLNDIVPTRFIKETGWEPAYNLGEIVRTAYKAYRKVK